ncbi:MAG: TRAP transporter small permease [Bacillota bacterium]
MNKIIDKTLDYLAIISLIIITIVTFAQVVSRYVFNFPIPWAMDIIRLSFVYLIFLGTAIGVREEGHLNIDVLINLLPINKKIVNILINTVTLAFISFLSYQGFVWINSSTSQGTPYLGIDMDYMYFAIPFTGIFMVYYLIKQIYRELAELKK